MIPANVVALTHADREARLSGGGTCTAAELAAAVGRDTARFVLARARPGTRPVLDLAVLSTATDANPAFRVRHAHARLYALARHAADLGIEAVPGEADAHPRELELRNLVAGYEGIDKPYPLARHLETVAEASARVELCAPPLPKGDEPVTDLHRARIALAADTRAVLADGLRRLDVTAPERM